MENRLERLRDGIDKIVLTGKSDHICIYISHMYGVARFCTLLAMKKNLDAELAATCGMLHDIFYIRAKYGTVSQSADRIWNWRDKMSNSCTN